MPSRFKGDPPETSHPSENDKIRALLSQVLLDDPGYHSVTHILLVLDSLPFKVRRDLFKG